MLSNQRYFPIYDAEGKLTREFIVVSNADPSCAERVIDGNERVVRARLDDAKFFFEEDLKHTLDEFAQRLETVVFKEKLGTVLQKTQRMEILAAEIALDETSSTEEAELAARAAHLAKADLVSQAVVEFTSQQGVMGGYYAEAAGEKSDVAA
ncbi:glycine--tRNA ligase subunit beta, partial [Mycobacterium tuberculosis]|uniref:glycine--tRNA ligase subunit beta n=1 Tax=Mycobacterium tuberculosis TaxID=1773 RepID=UPI001EEF15CC